MIGQDAATAALSDDCFDLSDNFLTVVRGTADGGQVVTESGATQVVICPGDGMADVVRFDSIGASGPNFTYLVTDDQNRILAVPGGDFADFDAAGTGDCRVWGLAYDGDLTAMTGADITTAMLATGCTDLSDNFITVIRVVPEGGTVALSDGSTEAVICPGDGMADVLTFVSAGTSDDTQFTYLITDEANNILAIPTGAEFDFDGAGSGVCRVWGLSYTGTLTAMMGQDAATAALSDDCFDLSDNFIAVIREIPEGGTIASESGATEVFACVGDGIADVVRFDSAGVSANTFFTYLITDDQNRILEIPGADQADFESAPVGVCRVWGLAYTGNLTAAVDAVITEVALSDDCFDLSDNFLTVERGQAIGGTVATEEGNSEVFVCPGNGISDLVRFDSTGVEGPSFVYIVTDDQNTILQIPEGDEFDFDDAGLGTCRVWGLAYDGQLVAAMGDDLLTTELASGCFDLSDNFITVVREEPNGGTVALSSGGTEIATCPGDGNPDVVSFTSTGATGPNFTFIVTDDANRILAIPTGNEADFEDAGLGTCRVWGLSYTGSLLAAPDDLLTEADLSDDCFDLSDNFITVIRQVPDGGTVALEGGGTEVQVCPGDGLADLVRVDSMTSATASYTYLVTDEDNIILMIPEGDEIDFDEAGIGICRIWGLAYTGNLTAEEGADAASAMLADDCFELSDNFVTVVRENVDAGSVSLQSGLDSIIICPSDGLDDFVRFDSSGHTASQFTYIITDDQNVVLAIPSGDRVNFDDAGVGVCRVWGLAYEGDLLISENGNLNDDILATGCSDLSDNFVTVIREIPEAGTITSDQGDQLMVCGGEGEIDIVEFVTDFSGNSEFVFLLARDSIIQGTISNTSFSLETLETGDYQVFGLAYLGDLTAGFGQPVFGSDLATSCFDITDNAIQIRVDAVNGGDLTTSTGATEAFACPNDGEDDIIFFETDSQADAQYVFLITTVDNLVLSVFGPDDNSFNFDNTGIEELRVYGLSFTGNLLATLGTNLNDGEMLSDACFDLSDNFVTVFSDDPDGGTIQLESGNPNFIFCTSVSDPFLEISTTSNSLAGYATVLTDTNNVVVRFMVGTMIDVANVPQGDYRLYGVSYTGDLLLQVGSDLLVDSISTFCNELSANFIDIELGPTLDGGDLTFLDGSTVFRACPNDDQDDLAVFVTSSMDTNYRYVITDTLDQIVIPNIAGSAVDFENAGPGVFRVYGISLRGTYQGFFGQNIFDAQLSDSCFVISNNFLTVLRQDSEGGTIFTIDGEEAVTVTVGDGQADVIEFATSDNTLPTYVYLITDENNSILAITDMPSFDFENAGVGVCRVWGLSFSGALLADVGTDIDTSLLATGCFDLSDNFVTVTRTDELLSDPATEQQRTEVVLRVYPNPVIDLLRLSIDQQLAQPARGMIQVFDSQGALILSREIDAGKSAMTLPIDVNSLQAGIYLVRYQVGDTLTAIRFLKQ